MTDFPAVSFSARRPSTGIVGRIKQDEMATIAVHGTAKLANVVAAAAAYLDELRAIDAGAEAMAKEISGIISDVAKRAPIGIVVQAVDHLLDDEHLSDARSSGVIRLIGQHDRAVMTAVRQADLDAGIDNEGGDYSGITQHDIRIGETGSSGDTLAEREAAVDRFVRFLRNQSGEKA